MSARTERRPRKLTPAQVEQYRTEGYLIGLPAIPAAQAAECCARFAAADTSRLAALDHPWHAQAHLLFTWAYRIVRHSTILDTMEDLLGPDLMVESADLFVKEPGSESFVSMHQDSYYWDIEPAGIATAWVALSEATPENGCMRFAARTHHGSKLPHAESSAAYNMLSRGQTMTLPEGTETGNYFLGVIVDELDANTELDETNNTSVLPVVVTPEETGIDDWRMH